MYVNVCPYVSSLLLNKCICLGFINNDVNGSLVNMTFTILQFDVYNFYSCQNIQEKSENADYGFVCHSRAIVSNGTQRLVFPGDKRAEVRGLYPPA